MDYSSNSRNNILALIGFAAKARKCSPGSEAAILAAKKGKAHLIILDGAAENTVKKVTAAAGTIPVIILNGAGIGKAAGKPDIKVISINDRQMAEAILSRYNAALAN